MSRKKSSTWTVYGLKDPRTQEVRYIGTTFALVERLRAHERDCAIRRPLKVWLSELGSEGIFPLHEVFEVGDGDQCAAERKWIAHYRSLGASLTNLTDGGRGQAGMKRSDDTKRRQIESSTGQKRSAEFRAKMREVSKNRPPEFWERAAAILKERAGKPMSAEARAKMSIAKKGKPWSAQRREAFEANGHPGRRQPHSEATKQKMSAAKRRRNQKGISNAA